MRDFQCDDVVCPVVDLFSNKKATQSTRIYIQSVYCAGRHWEIKVFLVKKRLRFPQKNKISTRDWL